nr:hypothetical protein [Tanacetum cinerariifolium]
MTKITHPKIPEDSERQRVPSYIKKETCANVKPKNKKLIDVEAEAVHMILNRIGNDVYSTVDACLNAKEMWIAIERLQHGESINVQDVKTKLFWEFGKFTSRDEESIESYYIRFYIMMNEMVRKKLKVDTMQRDKQMQKSLALMAKLFKNIYIPTNNNLRTSSNTMNKNMDTSLRTGNDRQTGYFGNQRTLTVVGNRKTVGNQVKDYEYHKEKMMLCKPESKGIPLSVEQNEWLHDTDEEPDDDYNVFASERQHSEQPESINDTYMVKNIDSNVIPDSLDVCDNEEKADQNTDEPEDERVLIASLIASNLKLDVDEKKRFKSN